ncbi:MAG: peptidase C39 family protein [Rhodospirillales bacterium]|nr:peptidase C39 family protein [Rhodospirillales bacterium]
MMDIMTQHNTIEQAAASARPFDAAIYFQTTEFTCGPAALMMAMGTLDTAYTPDRLEELKIWREANLIYMGDGHAGCGPYGLACAAIKRGYNVDIYEHKAENLFSPWTNNQEEARAQALLESHDRKKALRRGCRIVDEPLSKDLISKLIKENKQLITLTSKDLEGHWVIVHDILDSNVFIIDPYKAGKEKLHSPFHTDSGRNFIRYANFDTWIKYGPHDSTVLIALSRKAEKTG